ncbi:MAG: hypothetical protein R3F55_24050 [Alphaproteobacteria bacterium]
MSQAIGKMMMVLSCWAAGAALFLAFFDAAAADGPEVWPTLAAAALFVMPLAMLLRHAEQKAETERRRPD